MKSFDSNTGRTPSGAQTQAEATNEAGDLIAENYGRLSCYLGDTAFNEMARSFMRTQDPSGIAGASLLEALPQYLKKTSPYARCPEVAEFASLELAMKTATRGGCARPFKMKDPSLLETADFSHAVFTLQGPLSKFRFTTNVTSLWSSLRCGANPPKPERLASPVIVIVWRQAQASRFRIVGEEEAHILEAAGNGVPFNELCKVVANGDAPELAIKRVATYLRGWIEAELICDVSQVAAYAAVK